MIIAIMGTLMGIGGRWKKQDFFLKKCTGIGCRDAKGKTFSSNTTS
jgi:hypothetical protein